MNDIFEEYSLMNEKSGTLSKYISDIEEIVYPGTDIRIQIRRLNIPKLGIHNIPIPANFQISIDSCIITLPFDDYLDMDDIETISFINLNPMTFKIYPDNFNKEYIEAYAGISIKVVISIEDYYKGKERIRIADDLIIILNYFNEVDHVIYLNNYDIVGFESFGWLEFYKNYKDDRNDLQIYIARFLRKISDKLWRKKIK